MVRESSKELVVNLFRKRALSRVPFIPWMCSFPAKLEQVSVKKMLSDPTVLTRSLQNAQKLIGYDGIAVVLDTSLEAEACGCEIKWEKEGESPVITSHLLDGATTEDLNISEIQTRGRIPVVLEVARRIIRLKGREVAVLGVLTGPVTLAKHLKGNTFEVDSRNGSPKAAELIELTQKINVNLCRAYCEVGVDAIVIAEDLLGRIHPNLFNTQVSGAFKTLWNIARYYNVYSIVLARDCSQENVGPIFQLQADAVVMSGKIDFEHLRTSAIKHNRCFAANIPCSVLAGTQTLVRDVTRRSISAAENRGFFLSTEWEVPYNTLVTNVREIMKVIMEESANSTTTFNK